MIQLLLILAMSAWSQSGLKRNAGGDLIVGGEMVIEKIIIQSGGKEVQLSTAGFSGSDGPVTFSSNVVITGELRVNSAKSKAIFIPTGGIHLDDGLSEANVAPGQMFAKKIRTSTITVVGSAILFQDAFGVIQATMTATELSINGVNAGKLKNNFKGAGAPPNADCDEANEEGTQYYSRSPSRIYICVDNGVGGFGWGFTNINPP